MPLTGWLRSPQGAISVGPLAIPADAALALAIISTLRAGDQLTTSELSLRMLAPARPGGLVIARGSLLHARRTIALSEVTLTDEHGRLLAHGTSLCFILEGAGARTRPTASRPRPSATTLPTHGCATRSARSSRRIYGTRAAGSRCWRH